MAWNSPLVIERSVNHMTRSGCIIKTPGRLTYASAVELRYLGEMAELDIAELAAIYMALWGMELALIGAGVRGGIKHTKDLKVLTIKKPCKALMLKNGKGRYKMKNHDLINIRGLHPS